MRNRGGGGFDSPRSCRPDLTGSLRAPLCTACGWEQLSSTGLPSQPQSHRHCLLYRTKLSADDSTSASPWLQGQRSQPGPLGTPGPGRACPGKCPRKVCCFPQKPPCTGAVGVVPAATSPLGAQRGRLLSPNLPLLHLGHHQLVPGCMGFPPIAREDVSVASAGHLMYFTNHVLPATPGMSQKPTSQPP